MAATRRAYLRFLRSSGRLRDDGAQDPFSALRQAYDRHLSDLRGLSESSRGQHARTISAFLTHAVGPQQPLSAITHIDVERFVAQRSKTLSRHSMQHVIAHLRAFLRYCHDHGHIEAALNAIDTPRTYRAELPPKALPWPTVERLLASIDHKSKSGWRDHCILHLMAN
jgi:site-specific recombinase XerD